jgi:arylsulfatase A-like enzyme
MNRREFIEAALASLALGGAGCRSGKAFRPAAPNIILVLADDLGYGDVGWLFQNGRKADRPIRTPNLDRLAGEGLTLTDHYTGAPVCAPARASLLTGRTQGHCSVRDNQFDRPIREHDTLATVLKSAGYATFAVGKWGLAGGGESEQPVTAHPLDRGFDRFYGFLPHLAGHTYYHFDGYRGKAYMGIYNDREVATPSAVGIYSTDLFCARAKAYIAEHAAAQKSQPFFLYLAFNTVHGSGRENPTLACKENFHVPGRPYPEGGGLKGGAQWPLAPEPFEARNTWLDPSTAGWPKAMARYATSIQRLDRAVGDLMALLRDLKIDDDTLVVFTSDNGPTDEYGSDTRFFQSAGPFDGMKRDCFEGGMREPTFVRWPGHVKPGVSHLPCGFWDWMPTFAELGGAVVPHTTDGVSLLPTLIPAGAGRQRSSTVYSEYTGGRSSEQDFKEFAARKGGLKAVREQQQMLRIGDYVAVRAAVKTADAPLRLYNVVADPFQEHDLAGDPAQAGRLAAFRRGLTRVRRPLASAPRPYDTVPIAALTAEEVALAGELTVVTPEELNWLLGNPEASASRPGRLCLRVPETGSYTFTRTLRVFAARALAAFPKTRCDSFTGQSRPVSVRIHRAQLFLGEELSASIILEAGLHPVSIAWG